MRLPKIVLSNKQIKANVLFLYYSVLVGLAIGAFLPDVSYWNVLFSTVLTLVGIPLWVDVLLKLEGVLYAIKSKTSP